MASLIRTVPGAKPKDSPWPPRSLLPVGILGGTGLVGRMLARTLCSHPFLCCGPIVGSKRSAGARFEDVWREKEEALVNHYGAELWTADTDFPIGLKGTVVSTLDELIESECRVVISAIAPRLGHLEDILAEHGFTVVSISPYKRQEGTLCVLEANYAKMRDAFEAAARKAVAETAESAQSAAEAKQEPELAPKAPLFAREKLIKSPNCVCCGTSVVLKAVASSFGRLGEVSVTTFQSLSGRGDAKYAADLVVGNVYPLHGTSEPTEELIAEELETVLGDEHMASLSVTAYRVSVQRGHLVDVRIKLEDRAVAEQLQQPEDVYRVLEAFRPLESIRQHLPSVAAQPIICDRAGGAPRPRTHHVNGGGMAVTVGNVKVHDGPFDIALTLVVDNLAKGALGAALQLLEFRHFLSPLGSGTSL